VVPGVPESVLIGQSSDQWDAVALFQYASPKALFEMGLMPQYQEIHKYREAGLERTMLIACTPTGLFSVPQ
jgi:hypothetical protein